MKYAQMALGGVLLLPLAVGMAGCKPLTGAQQAAQECLERSIDLQTEKIASAPSWTSLNAYKNQFAACNVHIVISDDGNHASLAYPDDLVVTADRICDAGETGCGCDTRMTINDGDGPFVMTFQGEPTQVEND